MQSLLQRRDRVFKSKTGGSQLLFTWSLKGTYSVKNLQENEFAFLGDLNFFCIATVDFEGRGIALEAVRHFWMVTFPTGLGFCTDSRLSHIDVLKTPKDLVDAGDQRI